jgi:hypothetical protein
MRHGLYVAARVTVQPLLIVSTGDVGSYSRFFFGRVFADWFQTPGLMCWIRCPVEVPIHLCVRMKVVTLGSGPSL